MTFSDPLRRAAAAAACLLSLGVPATAQETPAPSRTEEPLHVAIIGDSLAGDLCRGFRRALDGVEGFDILCWAHPSSGLTRVDFFDWDATLRDYLAAHQVDVAFVTLGMNDAQRIVLPDAVLDFEDEAWAKVYGDRMEALVNQLRGAEADIVWVGLPTASSRRYSGKLARMNGIFEDRAEGLDLTYFSLWDRTSDGEGGYVSTLPDASGRDRPARQSDGIHFSMEGETLVACALLDHLPGGADIRGTSRHC